MVSPFIDLSHTFEDRMPGFRMKSADGTFVQYTAHIHPFLTHDDSRPFYNGHAEFTITKLSFQSSVGTYLDSPYHRWREGRDIAQIALDEVILPGVVIDARGLAAWDSLDVDLLPSAEVVRGRAVLVNFGWDRHWGTEDYYAYPFLSRAAIIHLAEAGAKLVGVDTLNIDDSHDPERPAHSTFLRQETLVVENLANLDALHGNKFRFFAVPLRARDAAAMPVRAFAEIVG